MILGATKQTAFKVTAVLAVTFILADCFYHYFYLRNARDVPVVNGRTSGPPKHLLPATPRITLEADLPGAARLGNLMFSYSSLVGLAGKFNASARLNDNQRLQLSHLFRLDRPSNAPDPQNDSSRCRRTEEMAERKASAYDPTLVERLRGVFSSASTACLRLRIGPYLQSWRYFHEQEAAVKSNFRFHDWIVRRVERTKRKIVERSFCTNASLTAGKCDPGSRGVVWIGVHVRRGDMDLGQSRTAGYLPATVDYVNRAVAFMESTFGNSSTIFLVASDDVQWCRYNVRSKSRLVFVEDAIKKEEDEEEDEEEEEERKFSGEILYRTVLDLAFLSSCNHVIMTVGSYGWWAGYLSGGTVVYFRDYPKPGSTIAKGFSAEDYYLPGWVGMR